MNVSCDQLTLAARSFTLSCRQLASNKVKPGARLAFRLHTKELLEAVCKVCAVLFTWVTQIKLVGFFTLSRSMKSPVLIDEVE